MSAPDGSGRMRLQKFLSDAGIASRRHAEELILEGRVLVNDEIVATLPVFVDPAQDTVIVDGAVVRTQAPVYFLVHKPPGVVCTHYDPAGRTRAVDLLPPMRQRLFPVGRLDEESSGLLLMTNDGELAQCMTHPRFGVPKVYRAEVRGRVPADLPEQLKRGVFLSDGRARAAQVEIIQASLDRSILNITLREGRNRQIRRMLAHLGHPVRKLKRLQIGPLSVKGLPVGGSRALTRRELNELRAAMRAASTRAAAGPRRRRRPPPKAGGGPASSSSSPGRPARQAQASQGRSRGGSKATSSRRIVR
jgi:23S rRNA pseudouridine2605 synthase